MRPSRRFLIDRAEAMLRRADRPRFQMSIIVLVTGAVGLLTSYLLLHLGLESMALRYPLAVLASYMAFLALLGLWLRYQRLRLDDVVSVVDLPTPDSIDIGSPGPEFTPGGGQFGGGGASASFDDGAAAGVVESAPPAPSLSSGGGWSVDVDGDELALVLIALAAVAGAVTASVYIVVAAPGLLAEILVDGLIAGALCRKLSHAESQHWLAAAVKKTWALALGLAVLLSVLGFAFQKFAPQATSVGDWLRSSSISRPAMRG